MRTDASGPSTEKTRVCVCAQADRPRSENIAKIYTGVAVGQLYTGVQYTGVATGPESRNRGILNGNIL